MFFRTNETTPNKSETPSSNASPLATNPGKWSCTTWDPLDEPGLQSRRQSHHQTRHVTVVMPHHSARIVYAEEFQIQQAGNMNIIASSRSFFIQTATSARRDTHGWPLPRPTRILLAKQSLQRRERRCWQKDNKFDPGCIVSDIFAWLVVQDNTSSATESSKAGISLIASYRTNGSIRIAVVLQGSTSSYQHVFRLCFFQTPSCPSYANPRHPSSFIHRLTLSMQP